MHRWNLFTSYTVLHQATQVEQLLPLFCRKNKKKKQYAICNVCPKCLYLLLSENHFSDLNEPCTGYFYYLKREDINSIRYVLEEEQGSDERYPEHGHEESQLGFCVCVPCLLSGAIVFSQQIHSLSLSALLIIFSSHSKGPGRHSAQTVSSTD